MLFGYAQDHLVVLLMFVIAQLDLEKALIATPAGAGGQGQTAFQQRADLPRCCSSHWENSICRGRLSAWIAATPPCRESRRLASSLNAGSRLMSMQPPQITPTSTQAGGDSESQPGERLEIRIVGQASIACRFILPLPAFGTKAPSSR